MCCLLVSVVTNRQHNVMITFIAIGVDSSKIGCVEIDRGGSIDVDFTHGILDLVASPSAKPAAAACHTNLRSKSAIQRGTLEYSIRVDRAAASVRTLGAGRAQSPVSAGCSTNTYVRSKSAIQRGTLEYPIRVRRAAASVGTLGAGRAQSPVSVSRTSRSRRRRGGWRRSDRCCGGPTCNCNFGAVKKDFWKRWGHGEVVGTTNR